jgi:hypothetical protein
MKKILEIVIEAFDKKAFMQKASDAYDTFVASYHADSEAIEKAVNAIFDRFPGARLNSDALRSFTLQELKVTPASFGLMTERLNTYLSANKGEEGKGLYGTAKGAGGGIWRWKDQPVKPAA